MKFIFLTQGQFAVVGDEFFEDLTKYAWYYLNGYAVRMVNTPKPKLIYMHREIMQAERGQLIDHIDGNGLNNLLENLRFADASRNMQNATTSNRTGYKGVYRTKYGRYQAMIYVNKKRLNLKSFGTPLEAAKAYDEGAKKHFGEFAKLNFP